MKAEVERLGKLLDKSESEVSRRLFGIGLQEYKKRAGSLLIEDIKIQTEATVIELEEAPRQLPAKRSRTG